MFILEKIKVLKHNKSAVEIGQQTKLNILLMCYSYFGAPHATPPPQLTRYYYYRIRIK